VRELMRWSDETIQEMEQVLTRWRASAAVLTNLEGLLTAKEIQGYGRLLVRQPGGTAMVQPHSVIGPSSSRSASRFGRACQSSTAALSLAETHGPVSPRGWTVLSVLSVSVSTTGRVSPFPTVLKTSPASGEAAVPNEWAPVGHHYPQS
jgi:hypothetical protein